MDKQTYTGTDLSDQVLPNGDEIVEITRKKKNKMPLPPYNIVGNGFTNRHGTSMDIIDLCAKLNTAEINLLQFFRDQYTYNIIRKEDYPNVVIPTSSEEFTAYLSTALKKNYLHMEYEQVVRRLKRGTYMINPVLFMPSDNHLSAYDKWNNAKREDAND